MNILLIDHYTNLPTNKIGFRSYYKNRKWFNLAGKESRYKYI